MMDPNASKDDSGFALNIVCETATKPSLTKKKKLNKYDKRRARNRNKNEQQKTPKTSSPNKQQRLTESSENEDDKKEVQQNGNHTEHILGGEVEKEETQKIVTEHEPYKGDTNDDQSLPEDNLSTSATLPSSSATKSIDAAEEATKTTATTTTTTRTPSRKHHVSHLEQEEDRARYMSEFHARPMEMDRRSGAAGRILMSQPSHHLFDSKSEKDELLPGLLPRLQSVCQKNFQMTQPTWIQTKTWQHFEREQKIDVKKNNNSSVLMIQSETGSGKTAAYLLPIVQKLSIMATKKTDRKSFGIQCVILAPTRELTLQIMNWVSALTQPLPPMIVGGCLSGGESRKSEKARIRKGITVLVATPGRLLDHFEKTEALTIGLKTNYDTASKILVLDESDRLLDQRVLGQQVQQIIQHLHSTTPSSSNIHHWRTVLVSATLNPKDESHNDMIRTVLGKNSDSCAQPWTWIRGQTEASAMTDKTAQTTKMVDSTPRQLNQFHMMVTAKLRLTSLIAFLLQRVQNKERTVVFMATCDGVDYHYELFKAIECLLSSKSSNDDSDPSLPHNNIFGCPLYRLHGQVLHTERQSILSKITSVQNNKEGMVLLATDVAARGLNLSSELHWTVQYDPPSEISEYAHRVGRSARAGHAGHSLLFLLPSEHGLLAILQHHYNQNSDSCAIQPLSLNQTLQKAAQICSEDLLLSSKTRIMNDKKKNNKYNSNRDGEQFCTELQRRLEDLILQDDANAQAQAKQQQQLQSSKKKRKREKVVGPLLEAARKAYFAHLRAYPTKEKQIRHLFSARALHLGHLARSLALRETPKMISTSRERPTKKEEQGDKNNERKKQNMKFDVKERQKDFSKNKKRKVVWNNPDGTVDTAKARRLIMERAQRLQQGGMESF